MLPVRESSEIFHLFVRHSKIFISSPKRNPSFYTKKEKHSFCEKMTFSDWPKDTLMCVSGYSFLFSRFSAICHNPIVEKHYTKNFTFSKFLQLAEVILRFFSRSIWTLVR